MTRKNACGGLSASAESVISQFRSAPVHDAEALARIIGVASFQTTSDELIALGDALALRYGRAGGYTHVPGWLSNVIAEFVRPFEPSTICDPWAEEGFLVGVLHNELRPTKASAYTMNAAKLSLGELLAPEVNWQCGDPLELLGRSGVEFDLIASNLPINVKTSKTVSVDTADGSTIELSGDLGGLILTAASNRLSSAGIGLFIVSPLFFSSPRSVFHRLGELGLGIEAAFSLPSGTFTFANIQTYLVAVRRKPSSRMFVAELSRKDNSRQVIENFHAGLEGETLELGRYVCTADFTGLNAIRAEETLKQKEKEYGTLSVALAELASVLTHGSSDEKKPFEDKENAIYIPLGGSSGIVVESVSDLRSKHQNYMQVVIDPSRSDSRFVARFLNSEIGREFLGRLRTGGVVARLSRHSLQSLPVFVPPLSVQHKILEVESRIDREHNTVLAFDNEILALRRKLWSGPAQIPGVENELNTLSERLSGKVADYARTSLDHWFETLPFPLASILRAWQGTVSQDHKSRYEHLLHFFEATAEFLGVLLLSAYASNEAVFEPHRRKILESMNKQNLSFHRATFGTWKLVLEYLGKQTRQLVSVDGKNKEAADADRALCKELFADPSLVLPRALARTELSSILSTTNKMRNDWSGHGGVVGHDVARQRNDKLLSQVQLLREVFEETWQSTQLIFALQCQPQRGIFKNDIAVAMGSNPEFVKETRELASWLDVERLYILKKDAPHALELLPLVRVGPSPPSAKNACYFFNRLERDGARFVSYHYVDTPELTDTFTDAAEAIRKLSDVDGIE